MVSIIIFSTPFNELLSSLRSSSLVNLTDLKGSSFAVKAFNFHPSRFYNIPFDYPGHPIRQTGMVYDDPAVAQAVNMVERAVRVNAPILIRGETGTGKELLARHAHMASGRKGDFVGVNCAALTETLVESELFGYSDGAFTGAARGGSVGLVAQAHQGTLFLDEIGVMPLQFQVKLLRFLDSMEIRPVGATKNIQLDIQLVSASNSDLTKAIETGEFRSDLFYRISAVEVVLPPLRERTDFKTVAGALLEGLENRPKIEKEAMDLLESCEWPGNIRELKNVLEKAATSSEAKRIELNDLPVYLIARSFAARNGDVPPGTNLLRQSKRDIERTLLESTLTKNNWNKSKTARQLGISRPLLYFLIEKYNLITSQGA